MYPQIFSAAEGVDAAFLIILGFSVFILVAVTIAMLWFLWRYNYKRSPKAANIHGNIWAEIIWTGLPTLIVLGLFWTGWTSFKAMRTIPEGAMEVAVEGRMWSWKFTYDNGKSSSELFAPVDQPVKLVMNTRDVIHSFYIPAMRVKWDLVPGIETTAWLESDTVGEYDIFCSEYCGLRHSDMITVLKVLPRDEFDQWLEGKPEETRQPDGKALMEEYGCFDCHAMDGSDDFAPPLNDIAGKERLLTLSDGTTKTVTVDELYLATAIMDPGAELVDGWDDEMPPYDLDFDETQLNAIVNFLMGKTPGASAAPAKHPGEDLADAEGCLSCHTTDGEDDIGPTFKGMFGKTTTVTNDSETKEFVIDEEYLRRAILHPSEWVVQDYDDTMPSYEDLDTDTLDGLVDYIKSWSEDAR